jgi:sortase B
MLGKKTVKMISWLIDLFVLIVILLLIGVGCYAMWDSKQIYKEASSAKYEVYKPTVEDTLSFSQLQSMNSEVIGWLTVYGTNIDYPVTQTDNNDKYVNCNAKGEYSLSGSLFLDCRNKQNFSDFNSIIYGHHMAESAMFGELTNFQKSDFFASHKYGELFYNGNEYGIEFFAFLKADAYDSDIFSPGITGTGNKTAYLSSLLAKSLQKRDIGVTTNDRILLLSTCTSDSTNGRHLLVGRITENTFQNTFTKETYKKSPFTVNTEKLTGMWHKVPIYMWLLIVVLFIILLVAATVNILRVKKKKKIEIKE